jgi:hypothetical protein
MAARMIVVDDCGRIAWLDAWPDVAAHSMDTDWYGVDPAGHVARLQSGEEGAVPYAAHRQYWEELFEDLVFARILANTPADPQADAQSLQRALRAARDPIETTIITAILGGDDASRTIYADYLEQHGRAVPRAVYDVHKHELREVDPASLPHEWNGILRFAHREYLELYTTDYHYDEWRPLAHSVIPAIAARGIQQWAFHDYWQAGTIAAAYMFERAVEPHHIGLYEYYCSFSGPYGRQTVPAEPLLVDALPDRLREILDRLRMPVRFATTEQLDPESWFDCQTYR